MYDSPVIVWKVAIRALRRAAELRGSSRLTDLTENPHTKSHKITQSAHEPR